MEAIFKKYRLNFKIPGGTSRGVLSSKETYFLKVTNGENYGIGECGLFRGLSADDVPGYEIQLMWLCENIHLDKDFLLSKLIEFPSIQFGLEQALLSLNSKDPFVLIPSKFTKGQDNISINGLVWMGDKLFMQNQIKEKLSKGFSTIKLKIGAIDFETELNLLKSIRNEFNSDEIEIRVDANGAFQVNDALVKLQRLSDFDLHSIEQPIQIKQWEEMAKLCEKSPIDIALDEELIGVFKTSEKEILINSIKPQYIILKPSLIGGIEGTEEWINIVDRYNIGWWITSALESNIGLNAIAQFTYSLQTIIPQGLGTGGLFSNNIKSPLKVKNGGLYYLNNRGDNDWQGYDSIFK